MGIRKTLEGVGINEQLSGAEIARIVTKEENLKKPLTRQAVSNTLKRAMGKVMKEVRKTDPSIDYFEAAVRLAVMFGIDEYEYTKFFKLFPPDVRRKVEEDAEKKLEKIRREKKK